MVGFNPDHDPVNVFNLIADSIRLHEIKSDPVTKKLYGVDHIF